jgi:predicted transposase YbfD/YdcC
MKVTTISDRLPLPNEALLFDLEGLSRCLQTVPDQRCRQGLRYPLASILLIGVLAKLAGQDSSRAIAHWAQLRKQERCLLFALQRQAMPHYSTWSRVLARGVDPTQLEQVLGDFFASSLAEETRLQRGSIEMCLDGKTLRGTIPLGESQGVHLLAASVPKQGVVLAQMQVNGAFDEPTQAPKLLACLDLRGIVVSGDALFAHQNLSLQMVQAHGDSLWVVKANQGYLYDEIQTLFEPVVSKPGWSAPPMDFRQAQTVEKGHGRLEKRTITVSSLLADYSQWPQAAQVFKLDSQRTDALGRTEQEVRYGITSLPAALADPHLLLPLSRGHWGIENGLHYRRDATMREDHAQLRMGQAPHLLAMLNNTAWGLLARNGASNLAHARRECSYQLDKALHALAS